MLPAKSITESINTKGDGLNNLLYVLEPRTAAYNYISGAF